MKYAKYMVLDIEGNNKDVRADPSSRTLGLSYAYRLPGAERGIVSGYLPFMHSGSNLPMEYLQVLREILHDTCKPGKTRTIYHNAKYDLIGLRNNLGIDLLNSDWYDTMLMVHYINENLPSKALDACSRHWGGHPKNKTEVQKKIEKSMGYEYVPVFMMTDYSTNDSLITLELFENILPEFNRQGFSGELWETEREWCRFITRMESVGISLDLEMCEREIVAGELRMAELCGKFGGNLGSSNFLAEVFFNRLHLPVVKSSTKTGKPSFDKDAMAKYDELLSESEDPTAQQIVEYRGWAKTVSSNYRAYFDLLSPDGFLRPNYKLHGTRTSRLSCEKPNLQQIPRSSPKRWNGNLKRAFIARPGYTLWEADYSQLELRLAAVYSRDPKLLSAFRSGANIFSAMAAELGWPRDNVKTFVYATLYGGGDNRIKNAFHIPLDRAHAMRETFFATYPALRQATRKAAALVRTRGYVKMWTGRRRHFPDPEKEAHKAFNAVLQGGGAEIVKRTGIRLDRMIDWEDCKVLLQVHDSYWFEIKEGTEDFWLPRIQEVMEDVKSMDSHLGLCPFPIELKQMGRADASANG